MTANRATIRTALASLITAYVTSAQTVHPNEPGDLGTESPIVILSSQGSDRSRMTFQGNQSALNFSVDIYTLAAETASGAYSYDNSADVVDACEAELAALVAAQQENGTWSSILYTGPSQIDFGIFGADGIYRFRERISLKITLFS